MLNSKTKLYKEEAVRRGVHQKTIQNWIKDGRMKLEMRLVESNAPDDAWSK